MRRRYLAPLLALVLASGQGCQGQPKSPADPMGEQRKQASSSKDPDVLSEWLISELLSPGGDAAQAKRARARLDELQIKGAHAAFARGLDDMFHGRPRRAAESFLEVLAAEAERDPNEEGAALGRLRAWYSAQKAYELSGHLEGFDEAHKKQFSDWLERPGNIGFRAYGTLVEMTARHQVRSRVQDRVARVRDLLGCVSTVQFAGPFGKGRSADLLESFEAEKPGPWPVRFHDELRPEDSPRRYDAKVRGCDADLDAPVREGIFYAQSYIELEKTEDLIIAASGAFRVWIDDHLVLDRDPRKFGVWPDFGVRVELGPGKHRVLWKLSSGSTSLRVVRPDGRALPVRSSALAPGFVGVPPRVLPNPNDLMAYVEGLQEEKEMSPAERFIVASLLDFEGSPDAASVLFEPLVRDPEKATGGVLMTAAGFVESDPIFDESQTRDLMHELYVRAEQRDRGLWYPRYATALWLGDQKGKVHALPKLEQQAREFPEVLTLEFTLAAFYEELGWGPEFEATVQRILEKFPTEPDALTYAIDVAESRGDHKKVEELLERLKKADPDTEVLFSRALSRRDYETAKSELKRLLSRRPERKDIQDRIDALLERSGDESVVWQRLERAVEREPRDIHARLALADAELARGQKSALARAVVSAIQAGGDPSLLESAIDLAEGVTALEPYRLDGKAVIAEFEREGTELAGTAARVLDYGAVLVRSDGSSQFLEHEIVRIQSEEAIRQFAEMDVGGLTLKLRVLKKDGRILEPESVRGKPTQTMPHLEVGDYVEQERIFSNWGRGDGSSYMGPTWNFREEGIAYARSEFVVIAPKAKSLIVEATGGAPEPVVTEAGPFVVRRFRVDRSPAYVSEPNSPPTAEFLPRVTVAWGLEFAERLDALRASAVTLTPVDPRVKRIAERIVEGVSEKRPLERARKLYHWILDNVQEGSTEDGRQVVVSRNGRRENGFEILCEALGIPVAWVMAESRIASPPRGPISEFERPLFPLLRVGSGKDVEYLTMDNRYAPFGTIPSHVRGQNAYVLGGGQLGKATIPLGGIDDSITYRGTGELKENGDAELHLEIVFEGKYGASLRAGLAEIPENQLPGIIESQLLAQHLSGARLVRHEVKKKDALDEPLILEVEVEVPHFGTMAGGVLLLGPPFMPRLSQLTSLAERKTPLLIAERVEQGLDLRVTLPPGYIAEVYPTSGAFGEKGSFFKIEDAYTSGATGPSTVRLKRRVVTEAGRIQVESYPKFQEYTRAADSALARAVRVRRTR